MQTFLNTLPIHTNPSIFFESNSFKVIPDDWCVVVADVRGSTAAIESGHYRDVNFVGAACITAFMQHLEAELPYVFGGDGASLLIHRSMQQAATAILASLCYWSKQCFDLELHAGIVPITALRPEAEIRIAKYQLAAGPVQTLFTGGGMSLAEQQVKQNPVWRVATTTAPVYDQAEIFSGLTCRWQPIPSSHGVVVSLLVEPLDNDLGNIRQCVEALHSFFDGGLDAACPVNMQQARYYSMWENLKRQKQVSGFGWNRRTLSALFEIVAGGVLFNLGGFRWNDRAKKYVEQIPVHCDFQKLDDTLRMVLDCSEKQCRAIQHLLETMAAEGRIVYGIHTSEAAQMTCYVETLADNGHLHFVDGNNGGYALAAKMLKQNLAAETRVTS